MPQCKKCGYYIRTVSGLKLHISHSHKYLKSSKIIKRKTTAILKKLKDEIEVEFDSGDRIEPDIMDDVVEKDETMNLISKDNLGTAPSSDGETDSDNGDNDGVGNVEGNVQLGEMVDEDSPPPNLANSEIIPPDYPVDNELQQMLDLMFDENNEEFELKETEHADWEMDNAVDVQLDIRVQNIMLDVQPAASRQQFNRPKLVNPFKLPADFHISRFIVENELTVHATSQLFELLAELNPQVEYTVKSHADAFNRMKEVSDIGNMKKYSIDLNCSIVLPESYKRFEFFSRNILEAVNQLWTDPNHSKIMHTEYKPYSGSGKCEMWNGEWWKRTEGHVRESTQNSSAKVAGVMLYSDSTVLTNIGGSECHPLYLYLANHPIDYRRKLTNHAIILLGYLPNLPDDNLGLPSYVYTLIKRHLFNKVMEIILDPLRASGENGVFLLNSEEKYEVVHPIVCQVVTDHMETVYYTGTRAVRAKRPCPQCLVPSSSLSDLTGALDGKYPLRTEIGTKQVIEETFKEKVSEIRHDKILKEYGLANVNRHCQNPFWKLPYMDIHEVVAVDTLHQLELGVWLHMTRFLYKMIRDKFGDDSAFVIQKIRARCCEIPYFRGLRIYAKGTFGAARVTAQEWRNLQKDIFNEEDLNNRVTEAFCLFLEFRLMVDFEHHTNETLDTMKSILINLERSFKSIFQKYSKSELNLVKFHALSHYIDNIRKFGSPSGTTTQLGEFAHQLFAKRAWKSSNHRNYIPQMVDFVKRKIKLSMLMRFTANSPLNKDADKETRAIALFRKKPRLWFSPRDSDAKFVDVKQFISEKLSAIPFIDKLLVTYALSPFAQEGYSIKSDMQKIFIYNSIHVKINENDPNSSPNDKEVIRCASNWGANLDTRNCFSSSNQIAQTKIDTLFALYIFSALSILAFWLIEQKC
ncbi:hypothetical protein HK098_006276 [Nowakowskiella sp. JEL0407]|nr:hypothetical protein HK098_006276 [Nowakowskiella sp. JEL0407]